ncbi:uncharacterized protein LOC111005007 [Momordica charantia]|uniref:Uncharacterized protein LOC111005007 n=1 Tax=Momordica charantia TaxID=3673 RepID=A0A6J1BR47_MOMCH|nr:uncharacterized protein LOC111005007 [Momordica charantia]
MTSNGAATTKSEASLPLECCMCGDFGFSYELFQCKICQYRSQHRYCSNLYPKAECYRICNWCLSQKEESKAKSPNSSNSSTSNKAQNSSGRDDYSSIKKPRNSNKDQIRTFQSQENRPIKKQRSPEVLPPPPPPPPPPQARRRPVAVDDTLRRTRSEEISHRTGIQRPVIFRNKVRRYKLLDEVSS